MIKMTPLGPARRKVTAPEEPLVPDFVPDEWPESVPEPEWVPAKEPVPA